MLPNELRPGRNSLEMHRLSQWKVAVSSERELTGESSRYRIMSEKYANGTSKNYRQSVKSRRDSPAFDTICCRTIEIDCETDGRRVVSSYSAETIRQRRINNESIDTRCKCRNFEIFDRDSRTNNCTNANCEYCNITSDSLDQCENDDDGDNVRWTKSTMRNTPLSKNTWHAILLILVGITSVCSSDPNQCAVGIKTPGRTWPPGDIVLEFGQSLKILCMLNKTFIDTVFPGKNSSDLVFFRNKKEIEPEYISIVNDTTIAMYVKKPPPAEDMYYCTLRLDNGYSKQHEAVCLNKVVIGFKPQEPQNFSCVSYNWENMTCSWDPVQNYVTTQFSLVFKLPGRAGGRKLYPCPKETQKPLPPNTCLWDTSTNPIYRQPYEYYTFILNVTNFLGVISVPYKFHHFAHVIPAKPANLSVVENTTGSALLHWSVPFPMQNFPPGLHHRVAYQHQWDHRKTWQVLNITSDIHMHKRYFNLTGLEYANTMYDVRVFMKSALAIGEDKWSQFSDVTFRTTARLPGLPPRTDIGSFEIAENNANRDVYLYWQAIPPYLENGPNFKYQIVHVEENGRKLYLSPNETTRTYAKFKGISFNSFRFEIVTTNDVGSNKERAKIFVPSKIEMPHEPLAFTKIAFDGGLYELSWKPPLATADVTNYTIFWCDNERDRPYQCTGYLDWVNVSRNTTIYNMTVPDSKKVYQFAISANTPRASSGMVWASCTVIHNKVVGKMKSVWINRIDSDFIEVGWKLDCSDRIGIVEGFNIYYCPIVSPYNLNCKGPKLNTTIRAEPHTIHGLVKGLKPYTTYMLAVAVLTKSGEGLHSDPLYNTTLEAAPTTPPQNISITNITNSTMSVSWNPPLAMNGVLRYYEVHFNADSIKVEETDHVTLRDLLAHKNYSIRVAACTVSCSVKSPALYRLTDIGTPGKIAEIPNVRFMNSSQVMVRWSPPYNPGGVLEYYQIWSADGEIRNSTKTEALLPILDCKTVAREKMYQFRVRAVNIAPDGMHLEGPWSDTGEGNCYSDGPSYRVWIIIWIISSLSGLAILFCLAYTLKRMWLKCKAMQDVEVKLPPGLAPNMKLLQKVGEQHMRQSSAESSGCSSGQESVTSSLTSDSHVSSDSGADVDSIHPPANKLLEPPPSWEASRLRQRNVSASRPIGTGDSLRWDSYVKVAKPGEPVIDDTVSLARSTPNLTESTVGYTGSPQVWSSTGYISMPSSEELSSNPSHVLKETAIKSSGYSVVGVAPKTLSCGKNDPDSEIARTDLDGSLISRTNDGKAKIPYVTLASLEQNTKDKRTNDSLGDLDDFDDLAFVEPNIDLLKPISIIGTTSKPYVQTGLLDTIKTPFVTIPKIEMKNDAPKRRLVGSSLTDSPFATKFSSSRAPKEKSMEISTTSKPYVAVGWMAELTVKSPGGVSSRVTNNPKSETRGNTEVTCKSHVGASSAFDTETASSSQKVDEIVPSLTSPSSCEVWHEKMADQTSATINNSNEKSIVMDKRAPSYVTVGENPRQEQRYKLSTSSPYVQHQRFDKQLPQKPSVPSTTDDERYSKVSVAPNTMQ